MRLGPPKRPLPDRWWRDLSREAIRRVVGVEMRGKPISSSNGSRGYVRLYLGRGNPYADSSGCQRLHRWIMQRYLGRRLKPYEHVHHVNGDKETTDPRELEVLQAVEHGQYHYGRNFVRRGGVLEHVSCGAEYTDDELDELSEERRRSTRRS